MNHNTISVIIPFYNAKEYITYAVESAIIQPETGEIIIIDDCSPDGGIKLCLDLEQKYERVKVLRHHDGMNHGAAASRNLGIMNSSYPFVSFLDADDYYLPNRFRTTFEKFNSHKNIDGVYEAIGATFQEEKYKKNFVDLNFKELTTVSKIVRPEHLFNELIMGKSGYFSFDGFTGKKDFLIKVGLFNEKLIFLEDTDFMLKLSLLGNLVPGSINKPVAIRRVHANNRITSHMRKEREIYKSYIKLWESFYDWGFIHFTKEQKKLVLIKLLARYRKSDYFKDSSLKDFIYSRRKMLSLAISDPLILSVPLFYKFLVPSSELFSKVNSGSIKW